jgi:hypothetical protein
MIEIPKWLTSTIDKYRCTNCNNIMKEEGIGAIGIKKFSKDESKSVFYFSYECENCKHKVTVELNTMSTEEFVSNMVEEYMQDNENEKVNCKNVKNNSTKISDQEYKAMLKSLNDYEYWDDMLLDAGFSQREIDEYKAEGREEFSKRKSKA